MTFKLTKLAAILAAGLSIAAPLALTTSAADAAPMRGGPAINVSYHDNGGNFSDRNHAPAPRMEKRSAMPHFGYRWHQGNWNFRRGHWVWVSGFWNAR